MSSTWNAGGRPAGGFTAKACSRWPLSRCWAALAGKKSHNKNRAPFGRSIFIARRNSLAPVDRDKHSWPAAGLAVEIRPNSIFDIVLQVTVGPADGIRHAAARLPK